MSCEHVAVLRGVPVTMSWSHGIVSPKKANEFLRRLRREGQSFIDFLVNKAEEVETLGFPRSAELWMKDALRAEALLKEMQSQSYGAVA